MPDLTQEGLAARGLRVKALEWFDAPNICTREKAAALGGHYSVVEFDAGTDEAHFAVNIDLGGLAFVFILEPDPLGGRRPKRYPTLEAARAAAQADYAARILAALEDTGEPALIREAEARGMERAMPTDQAIHDLADHMWRVHPRELDEGGYVSKWFGGKYENPLAAWYADQIKALCRGASTRAAAAALRKDEEPK